MKKSESINRSIESSYDRFGMEITRSPEVWDDLAENYNLEPSEVAQIDFNRSGIYLPNHEVREDFRVRFKGKLFNGNESWFALPVRGDKDAQFHAAFGKLYFGDIEIGETDGLALDTCESSYQRGPNLLNLNSRSRSNCGGCHACVHNYNLYDETVIKDNLSLTTEENVSKFFDTNKLDVAKLKQIAVVTGLFGSEENVVEHMKMVNKVAKERGFAGELMYFGCEVNSEMALDELAKIDNFALIYALDNFTKRDQLLTKTKSLITVDVAKQTLDNAKNRGINTSIAYIAGIDPISDMADGFMKLRDSLTRFPVVNIYQVQTQGQANIMDRDAKRLEYYVQSRVILENIFKDSNMRPRRWENYRPLWYQYFAGEKLPSNSYGENE